MHTCSRFKQKDISNFAAKTAILESMQSIESDIFKKGSTTYYWSSKFFPKDIRDDVFKLYSFVRVADDYVDQIPQDRSNFAYLVHGWSEIKKDLSKSRPIHPETSVNDRVLSNVAYVVHRYKCDPEWIDAFLRSMQMDLDAVKYESLDDTLSYIYGSAEVIGLCMAKIMGLSAKATHAAQMQGRAMQYINFLRDIAEDNELGRLYFPHEDLAQFSLESLEKEYIRNNKASFIGFMHFELARYKKWQQEANDGFMYIPKRLRIAIRTAVDMYNWTAKEIEKDPFIVFQKKVKPRKKRIIRAVARRTIRG